MKRFFFALYLMVFAIVNVADAQTTEFNAWQIVERCLPEPTIPDDTWSYNGEILLYGWAGIHGVNASQDMPYVVRWGRRGILSPDGQWALTQSQNVEVEQLSSPGAMGRYHFYYRDIVVQNLTTGELRVFEWEGYNTFRSRPYLLRTAEPMWLDNQHFAAFYGSYGNEVKIGNIETGEVTDWEGVSFEEYELSISPDQTRIISYAQLYKLPEMTLLQQQPVGTSYDFDRSFWASDSSMFADRVFDEENGRRELTIFDRDGNRLAVPFQDRAIGMEFGQWSPTSRYISFMGTGEVEGRSYDSRSFLLDIEQERIIDLCVENMRPLLAWSPDGSKFAVISGEGQQPIVVTDMDSWQSHIVGYHTGNVVFWRGLE